MPKRDFINTDDFSREEMQHVAKLGLKIKEAISHGYYPPLLENRSLGMIFEQTSTRTRTSAETSMTELGGHALYLAPGQIQLGNSGHEGLADTGRVLGDLVDLIGVRVNTHDEVVTLAETSKAPVVNFLCDQDHPLQAVGDLITIKEHMPAGKDLSEIKLVFVGDSTQIAVSTMLLCAIMGMQFVQYGPEEKWMPEGVLNRAQKLAAKSGGTILLSEDEEVLDGADFVYTDVWYGLYDHQLTKEEYMKIFYPKYQVDDVMLQKTNNPNVKFMHCLPASRGEEVTASVLDGKCSIAWPQATNKKTAMSAVFAYLLKSTAAKPSASLVKKYQTELDELLDQKL